MVKLVNVHVSEHYNSCKCNNTLIVVVGIGLVKVGGVNFETWVICHYPSLPHHYEDGVQDLGGDLKKKPVGKSDVLPTMSTIDPINTKSYGRSFTHSYFW